MADYWECESRDDCDEAREERDRLEFLCRELVGALEQLLPFLENIETRALIGDEGCLWAVEIIRDKLTKAKKELD